MDTNPKYRRRVVNVLISFQDSNAAKTIFDYVDPVSGKLATLTPERELNEFAKLVDAVKYTRTMIMEIQSHKLGGGRIGNFDGSLRFCTSGDTEGNTKAYRTIYVISVWIRRMTTCCWMRKTREFGKRSLEFPRRINQRRDHWQDHLRWSYGSATEQVVKRLRARFSEVSIYPAVMAKAIIRQLDKSAVVITPKPWVSCCCPRNQDGCAKAACRKTSGFTPGDIGPDYSAAGPNVCPNCPWH